MSEKELNEKYIRNKISGICQDCIYLDKIVPIINEMLSEQYIEGLQQGHFDNQMDLIQLQQKIDSMKESYETDAEAKFYEYVDKHESKLQQRINRALEYIEYNDETLYTYEPDYDYEENIVSNYDVSSFREDLLEILKGEPNNENRS